jgi:hypothetical protein
LLPQGKKKRTVKDLAGLRSGAACCGSEGNISRHHALTQQQVILKGLLMNGICVAAAQSATAMLKYQRCSPYQP